MNENNDNNHENNNNNKNINHEINNDIEQPMVELTLNSRKDAEYELEVKLNEICINWKPDTILKVMDLLRVFRVKKYQLQEKDVEIKNKGDSMSNQQIVAEMVLKNPQFKDRVLCYERSDILSVKDR
jgi:predicted acetyltransferase